MNRRAALFAASLLLLLTAGCASAPPGMGTPRLVSGEEGEGEFGSWVYSGGYRRTYLLSVPEGIETAGPRPLLVVMHGAGGTAEGLRRWSGLDTMATDAGFVTVFPEGLLRSWDMGCHDCTPAGALPVNDIRFIETLIRHLAENLPVDTARVFLAGHSLGGQFVHHYACRATLKPAGIASVAGLWMRNSAVRCGEQPGLPVLMIHGDRDPILPWNGPLHTVGALSVPEGLARWTNLLGCEAQLRISERPDSAGDGTSVEVTDVGPCPEGGHVRVLRIRGGGHGWPGRAHDIPQLGPTTANLDGGVEILSFFAQYAWPAGGSWELPERAPTTPLQSAVVR